MEATLKFLLQQRHKKGFTLIELIVVLVIMAVLAAAAIPTMMGYVERAKMSAHLAEFRAAIVAIKVAETLTIVDPKAEANSDSYDILFSPLSSQEKIDIVFKKYLEQNLANDIKSQNLWVNIRKNAMSGSGGEAVGETTTLIFLYLKDDRSEYFKYESKNGDEGTITYHNNDKKIEL